MKIHKGVKYVSVVNPSNALAMFPLTMFLFSLCINIDSAPMLFALVPRPDVLATVGPLERTLSLLHIVDVFTNISSPIRPRECAVTLHLVVAPFPGKDSAVSPLIDARTVDIIVVEVPCVGAVVGPSELTLAVFLSLEVLPIV